MRHHLHIDEGGKRTMTDLPDETAEELAATAAQLAAGVDRAGKIKDIRDQVIDELALVKAGTTDFGNAARNRCIRRMLRAIRYLLSSEVDE